MSQSENASENVSDNASENAPDNTSNNARHFGRIAAVYLLGLLVGGLYVGIVAPLRTVIQSDMAIDSSLGIWIINIYTLFYAATIPVAGNLADRYGRKSVYCGCLAIFSLGALLCGVSQTLGGFPLLLLGRVIQAAGAGGVIPVATSAMGVLAPEGKRGMWLGISSAVAGLANVLGAAVGSVISSIVGVHGWCWAFLVVVPIGILLVLLALLWLPRSEVEPQGRLDVTGSILFVAFVLCLLVGLKGIEFANPIGSALKATTFGPVLAAVVLVLVFRVVEHHAQDPVFHLKYLHNRRIRIIMAVSFFVGCCIITMSLVPEFAEAVLGVEVGSGGYYMAIIGIFAIVGPPVGGKLIDKHGAKPVLLSGLLVTAAGFGFLAFFVTANPSIPAMLVGLSVVGLGMGFTMGTPLNYMILQNTTDEESSSAIATISLVRQMGTTLAPALLVGFTTAGLGIAGYCYMMATVMVTNLVSMALLARY